MELKFLDFVKFIETSTCLDELRIKCDLMYGIDFEYILDKFLIIFKTSLSYDFIRNVNLKCLSDYLLYIGKSYEKNHRIYIHKNIDFDTTSTDYTRYTDEYYLMDSAKIENISINI